MRKFYEINAKYYDDQPDIFTYGHELKYTAQEDCKFLFVFDKHRPKINGEIYQMAKQVNNSRCREISINDLPEYMIEYLTPVEVAKMRINREQNEPFLLCT